MQRGMQTEAIGMTRNAMVKSAADKKRRADFGRRWILAGHVCGSDDWRMGLWVREFLCNAGQGT